MFNFLRKLFIKDYKDINNPTVRQKHGKLACIVGILSNLLLFTIKMIFGIVAKSISIIGDSFNNLSDMGSSGITLFGFHMANKPADENHPYGHERYEYVSSLIVSVIIIVVGVQLLIESVTRFWNGLTVYSKTDYSTITIIILVLSILIKLLQGIFNKKMGKLIHSLSLEATARDSINDVITTSTILVATIISMIWPKIMIGDYYISIDSFMGAAVAIFIMVSGAKLIHETINPLIGVGPDSDFVKAIVSDIESYEGVLGVHDVICHMYGPSTCFMSAHVEVDSTVDINVSHDIIDNIEHEIRKKHHVELVIHMDPIDSHSEEVQQYKNEIESILSNISPELSFHDFRIVKGDTHTNVIFDCVIPFKFSLTKEELKDIVQKEITKYNDKLFVVINFDIEYTKNMMS